MDPEMSTCSCFLLRQLFLVRKTAHARGAVREPPGVGIEECLTLAVYLFLKRFLEPIFAKKYDFCGKMLPKWTQNDDLGKLFFRKSVKLKKCVWTAPAWTDCI